MGGVGSGTVIYFLFAPKIFVTKGILKWANTTFIVHTFHSIKIWNY